ncbi:MAG: hypothetical protein ACFFDN_17215, partial [Candidatus Hodarchaeota archaeon]
GTLTVNNSFLSGIYVNTTTLINCIVNAKKLYICAYGTSSTQLQSYLEKLTIDTYDYATLSAFGVIKNKTTINGRDHSIISVINVNNSEMIVMGYDHTTIHVENSTLRNCFCFDYANVTIFNSTVSIGACACGFSSMIIDTSIVSALIYGIYYSSGNININDGILPIGFVNCCSIINSPDPVKIFSYIYFKGFMTVNISGTTPSWSFYAMENVLMNIQSATTDSGIFLYYDESYGEIKDSNVGYIYSYSKKYCSVIVDNSNVDNLYAGGRDLVILVNNSSNIENTYIYFA